MRGVQVTGDVRPPLRGLTGEEQAELENLLPIWLEAPAVR
jgi:hypothetical protein